MIKRILGITRSKEKIDNGIDPYEFINVSIVEILGFLKDPKSPIHHSKHSILEDIYMTIDDDGSDYSNGLLLVDPIESRYYFDYNFQVNQNLFLTFMIPKDNKLAIKMVFTSKDNPVHGFNQEQIVFYLCEEYIGQVGSQYTVFENYTTSSRHVGSVMINGKCHYIYFTHFGEN